MQSLMKENSTPVTRLMHWKWMRTRWLGSVTIWLQTHEHMKGFNPKERYDLCLITSYRLLIVFVNYLANSENPCNEAAHMLDHLHEQMKDRLLNKIEAMVVHQNEGIH